MFDLRSGTLPLHPHNSACSADQRNCHAPAWYSPGDKGNRYAVVVVRIMRLTVDLLSQLPLLTTLSAAELYNTET
jgi:hypothetical protein